MFAHKTYYYLLLVSFYAVCVKGSSRSPNILIVITDDQDQILDGMFPMKRVQRLIGSSGVTFSNAFTSSPLCCPSRASILSGMYAHNHKTTNNSVSGGCNGNYWREKVEPHSLPALLQKSGYDTFFAGKYLNQYKGAEVPPGWNDFHGLHGNSVYYNYTMRENGLNVSYTDSYLTDILRDLALQFLTNHMNSTRPFFAIVAPPACHEPFTPADRHRNTFSGITALRTPNFNIESDPLEKHWLVANSQVIPQNVLKTMDIYFQSRWESLLAVDELVAALIQRMDEQKQLENTYIIYTSDNGFHIGQFAQPYDKRQPYETDIRIPLLIRGPDVPGGVTVAAPVLLLDLFSTVLDWAKVPEAPNSDGKSLQPLLTHSTKYEKLLSNQYHRSLLIQHWGEGNYETYNAECPWNRTDRLAHCIKSTDCHCQDAWNNTYACVRHFRSSVNRLYCEFKDKENFVEAYDLAADPFQLKNIVYELLPIEQAFYSLALANLTRCVGDSCGNINI